MTTAEALPEPLVLADLVRVTMEKNTNEADPGVIAYLVAEQIQDSDLREALQQTLQPYVRSIFSEVRAEGRTSSRGALRPVGTNPNRGSKTTQDGSSRSNPSWKQRSISAAWTKREQERFHVGGGAFKFLAECNYDDLLAAAQERRNQAEGLQVIAREIDSWARLLTEHDVLTFGELPVAVRRQALGG